MGSGCVALVFGACLTAVSAESLEKQLARLVKEHRGTTAVAVKNLLTGESVHLNADEPLPTASLIKLPVAIELLLQAQEERLKLSDMVTLREADKVPGAGLLTYHFGAGDTFTLRTAGRLMMTVSDNTATNLVLGKVGLEAVNRRMAAWQLEHTRINSLVSRPETRLDPERGKQFALGSTTAREMIRLLEDLALGERLRPAVKQMLLTWMRNNEGRDKFGRLLPAEAGLVHKDGTDLQVRTDAGILETPAGPVVLCVLTARNEDRSWATESAGNVLCARVARTVWDHFQTARADR